MVFDFQSCSKRWSMDSLIYSLLLPKRPVFTWDPGRMGYFVPSKPSVCTHISHYLFLQMLQLLFDTPNQCFRGNWGAEDCWEKGAREARKGRNMVAPHERNCPFCGLCTSAVYSAPAQHISQTSQSLKLKGRSKGF